MNTPAPTVPIPPAYYSLEQAAQALNLSVRSVRRMISCGELKAKKMLGQIRIPVSAIEKAGTPIRTYQH